jgi:hypothetical protein
MKGDGVEWHLYGVDECVLSEETMAPRLQAAFREGEALQMILFGKANRTNWIERSGDLHAWAPWTNLFNFSGIAPFEDAWSGESQARFYRARQQ